MENKKLIRFEEMEINKPLVINIEGKSRLKIDGVSFTENLVSKVELVKHKFDDSCDLFIETYAGNLELTTTIVKEDYIIERTNLVGRPDYYIRKAESYDYR